MASSNQLKMADLRAAVKSLGLSDAQTYLQRNVVLTTSRPQDHLGEAISNLLREIFGIDVPVITRTSAEMASIVAANPYQSDDPTKVVVTFLAAAGVLPDLDLDAFAPEGLTLHGREMYLDLPFGQGRSRLAAALTQFDDATRTARNWRTVMALKEMSASPVD